MTILQIPIKQSRHECTIADITFKFNSNSYSKKPYCPDKIAFLNGTFSFAAQWWGWN
jgi:hypothetical protein